MAEHAATVRLSTEGRRGWQKLKRQSGSSVTALIEAIGLLLDQGKIVLPDEVLELAREVQATRDSR